MSKAYYLGIDTSNYTTSLAVVNEQAELVANIKQLLPVKTGERGLRQSEALFWHVKNLPLLMKETSEKIPDLGEFLRAAAVSTSPRPVDDSYMPVFLAGSGLAESLTALLQIPCFGLSHQENHIWAGLYSAGGPQAEQFLAVHLSGGTSEIVSASVKSGYCLDLEILGGSSDLNAGQLVDRIGTAMDLPFPAGRDLERLALNSTKDLVIPSYHRDGQISFSGAEAAAVRMLQTEQHADIAKAVLLNIARTVTKLIDWAQQQTQLTKVLMVGGVCSNLIIRKELVKRLPQLELFFAEPRLSVDNAVGAAVFAGLSSAGDSFIQHVF